ncbi:G patch domain-containing protein 4 [Spea bombifrons]|uniref:G patch domain-containing protein 4 n=1 Tax=Spea bombifrons TaxID=233779 RepID=UPI00234933F7|nr:G patch domain-containing protein 4 [Spea bombifrons]
MAAPSEKNQGIKFAENQLRRHGWVEGKGLGKQENGISEAIKVKVKCGKAGVGHNSAEQFTFHWWDHVFNQTASSIAVEAGKDGVQVKKLKEEPSEVTNKKPRKALLNKDMLYGRFVKTATLMSGGEMPVEKSSSSESSDSEDEDEKLNLSSATKLTDEDLMKICGGRTAHKGARHGLTMSAKLSRLEEQERAFLEKYGNKKPDDKKTSLDEALGSGKKHKKNKKCSSEPENDGSDDSPSELPTRRKKKKRELEKEHGELVLNSCEDKAEQAVHPEGTSVTKKKKKKKNKQRDCPEHSVEHVKSKKKNKHKE